MYVIQGQREKSYLYIQKGLFVKNMSCGYKMVTVIRLRLTTAAVGGSIGTTKEDSKHDGPNGGGRQKVNRRTPGEAPP